MRILIIALFVISLMSCNKSEDNAITTKLDSIAMGTGYASDIYYSFKNGIVTTTPRNNWDLGFKTNPRSSSIIINSTLGLKLWQSPISDTASWSTKLDTTGLKLSWKSLLDSDTTWSLSAFEANQTGHPNYGWGDYNQITHDVVGKAIFVIQLADKSYKKIWIKKRFAIGNTYSISYANLDGSSSVNATIKCSDYLTKNFVYYKISSGEIIDREPVQADWDILLTKYYEMVFNSATQAKEPYNVTGILQNEGVLAAEVNGDVASNSYSSAAFSTAFSVIGSDWKTLDMQTFVYTMKPEVKYFVQTKDKSIYKLVFKKFEGSSTGKVVFEKTKLK